MGRNANERRVVAAKGNVVVASREEQERTDPFFLRKSLVLGDRAKEGLVGAPGPVVRRRWRRAVGIQRREKGLDVARDGQRRQAERVVVPKLAGDVEVQPVEERVDHVLGRLEIDERRAITLFRSVNAYMEPLFGPRRRNQSRRTRVGFTGSPGLDKLEAAAKRHDFHRSLLAPGSKNPATEGVAHVACRGRPADDHGAEELDRENCNMHINEREEQRRCNDGKSKELCDTSSQRRTAFGRPSAKGARPVSEGILRNGEELFEQRARRGGAFDGVGDTTPSQKTCERCAVFLRSPPPLPWRAGVASLLLFVACQKPAAVDLRPDGSPPGAVVNSINYKAFSTAADALAVVLATKPRVVAFGEAHARAGATGKSTVERFQEELLPQAAGVRSLIIELVVPNPACTKAEVAPARATGAEIAKGQHPANQNRYLALGTTAKKQGITPYPLVPTCEALGAIGKAAGEAPDSLARDGGPPTTGASGGDVAAMLTLVAATAGTRAEALLGADDKGLWMYGGALHNDRLPRAGTEDFSFGPRLDRATGGSYAEVDLVLPDQIEATDVWKRLPWYSMYDARTQSDRAWLYEIAPRRWVLFFPADRPRP